MRKICLAILLYAFLAVCGFAVAASSDLEINQESEQRIASMELNQSAGNMTGEDYAIALIYAYLQDVQNGTYMMSPGPIIKSIKVEALSNFPEYKTVYNLIEDMGSVNLKLTEMLFIPPSIVTGSRCENISEIPESNIIRVIQFVFDEGGFMETAQTAYHKRIAEEAESNAARDKRESELKAIQEKKEADRLIKQQENEARQAALDAHYKDLFDNTTRELERLEDKSRNTTDNSSKEAYCQDALRLLNNSSAYLVSPYSNMLSMSAGNILIEMSRLSDDHHKNLMTIVLAGEWYKNALTNFTYSNESEDYQNAIHQDFMDKHGDILKMMADGIIGDRFTNEIEALVTDLRDAPNVKQLLSGHINKKYEITVLNYTEPMLINAIKASDYPYSAPLGYWVQVNLSAYNDPAASVSDIEKYAAQNIPTCIDIFSSLFRDERISVVYVRLNETYYDRFGHTEERSVMSARLDNVTATEIGDWPTFKKYVGTDMDRFKQAVDVTY